MTWTIVPEIEFIGQKVPKKHSIGFTEIPIVLTTICSFNQHICLGTNIGLMYLVHISTGNVTTIQISKKYEHISAISCSSSISDMIAVGCKSGLIQILKLPMYQHEQQSSFIAYKKIEDPTVAQLLKWFDGKFGNHAIKCFTWTKNGDRLFTGDDSGQVMVFEFNYESSVCQIFPVVAVDMPVVEISYSHFYLAISSEDMCVLFDIKSKVLRRCGNQTTRKDIGQFGCTFLERCGSKKTPTLICTRSRNRLWVLDNDGVVKWTYIAHNMLCEELLTLPDANLPNERPVFGCLYNINKDLIISYSWKHIIVFDYVEKRPTAHIKNYGRIKDISILNETVLLLLQNNELKALSLNPANLCDIGLEHVDNSNVGKNNAFIPWVESKLKIQKDALKSFTSRLLENTHENIQEGLPIPNVLLKNDDIETNDSDDRPLHNALESNIGEDTPREIVIKPVKRSKIISEKTSSKICDQEGKNIQYNDVPIHSQPQDLPASIHIKEKQLANTLGFSPDPVQESLPDENAQTPDIIEEDEMIPDENFTFQDISRLVSTDSTVLSEDSTQDDRMHPNYLEALDSLQVSDLKFEAPKFSSQHSCDLSLVSNCSSICDSSLDNEVISKHWSIRNLSSDVKTMSGLRKGIMFSDGSEILHLYFSSELKCSSIVLPKNIDFIDSSSNNECGLVIMSDCLYSVKFPSVTNQYQYQYKTSITFLEENVKSVSRFNGIIWMINSDGQVSISKSQEIFSRIKLESTSYTLCKIVCKNGVVWGLTTEGKILYRVGIEVNGWGVDWAETSGCDLRTTDIHISEHGLGWKVAESGCLFVLPYLNQQFPQGLDGRWWEINILDVQLNRTNIRLTSDDNNLWLTDGSSTAYSHPLQSFTGFRWENRLPVEFHSISAGSIHVDYGVIYALQNEKTLLMVNPRSLNVVEIPTPSGQSIHCISSRPEALWILSESGNVYVRDGLGPNLNIGVSWIKLDLSQIDDVHLSYISLGLEVAWAVDEEGKTFMRQGPFNISYKQTTLAAWLQIDSPPYVKFRKIFTGAKSHLVWAIDSENNIYVRQAISSDLATGLSWICLTDMKALTITISEDRVFMLSISGELFEREGISSVNYIGDSWKKLPCGGIIDISVSTDNCLWALNEEGKIIQQYVLEMKHKFPPLSSDLDSIVDDDDFEIV